MQCSFIFEKDNVEDGTIEGAGGSTTAIVVDSDTDKKVNFYCVTLKTDQPSKFEIRFR
jgi:hypothetical protein